MAVGKWPGPAGEEYALILGAEHRQRVLVLPALFEEANKTRHFTVEVMRHLSRNGVGAVLPDLPGCNESLAPAEAQSLASWRDAVQAAAAHFGASHCLAIRGGSLLAPPNLPGWRYAPATGASILRAMLRARMIASREAGKEESRDALMERGLAEGLELGGYRLGPEMIAALQAAEPPEAPCQTDIAQSEIGGAGLWLRAEPDHNAEQAETLAGLILEGIARPATSSDETKKGASRTPALLEAVGGAALPAAAEQLPKRRHLQFLCEDETLAGTLDDAPGRSGVLIVTGGNETRAGTFAGQAQLAARIAAAGHPVFRFDRRGTGDSSGSNGGFTSSAPDIAAALLTFRREKPEMKRVVAYGNCDAASALMLEGGTGFAALMLANPWTFEEEDEAPPPAAIRSRYAEKLRNPRELLRLVRGEVSFTKLAGGLARAARAAPPPTSLLQAMQTGIGAFPGPIRFLVAERDRTGQAFLSGCDKNDPRLHTCPGASHAFVEPQACDWLFYQLLDTLAQEETGQLHMG